MQLIHSATPEPEEMPACIRCGGDDVTVETAGFCCGPCNLVFEGTAEEWDQWTHRRREATDRSHLRSV